MCVWRTSADIWRYERDDGRNGGRAAGRQLTRTQNDEQCNAHFYVFYFSLHFESDHLLVLINYDAPDDANVMADKQMEMLLRSMQMCVYLFYYLMRILL